MRRRLGVSPAPVASNGPVIVTLRSATFAGRLTVGLMNGRRFASASTVGVFRNVAATSCGPALTGIRTSRFWFCSLPSASTERPPPLIVEQLDAFAVEHEIELGGAGEVGEIEAERVLGVLRKHVGDERAAARAERQALDAIVLEQAGRDGVGLRARTGRCVADRDAADLARRRQIALHQRLRHLEHAGHVVEAVAGAVARQERGDVDVEREHVADGVVILGAVQAMERFGAAGIRARRRGAVERGLEIR